MISDRKMSKLKSGIPLKLSVAQFVAILFAVIHAMLLTQKTDVAEDLSARHSPCSCSECHYFWF